MVTMGVELAKGFGLDTIEAPAGCGSFLFVGGVDARRMVCRTVWRWDRMKDLALGMNGCLLRPRVYE